MRSVAWCIREFQSGFERPPAPESLFSAWPEKSNQKRGHPGWRLPGVLPGKSVRRGRAFRAGSCPREKALPSMATPAVRPDRPRLTAAQGPHKSRRASCAPEAEARAPQARGLCFMPLLLRAGSALLYAGPLWRGGWAKESPQGGRHGCRPVFRRDRSPVEKPRSPPAHPEGRMPGGRAIGGAVSLWLLSLWAS